MKTESSCCFQLSLKLISMEKFIFLFVGGDGEFIKSINSFEIFCVVFFSGFSCLYDWKDTKIKLFFSLSILKLEKFSWEESIFLSYHIRFLSVANNFYIFFIITKEEKTCSFSQFEYQMKSRLVSNENNFSTYQYEQTKKCFFLLTMTTESFILYFFLCADKKKAQS